MLYICKRRLVKSRTFGRSLETSFRTLWQSVELECWQLRVIVGEMEGVGMVSQVRWVGFVVVGVWVLRKGRSRGFPSVFGRHSKLECDFTKEAAREWRCRGKRSRVSLSVQFNEFFWCQSEPQPWIRGEGRELLMWKAQMCRQYWACWIQRIKKAETKDKVLQVWLNLDDYSFSFCFLLYIEHNPGFIH